MIAQQFIAVVIAATVLPSYASLEQTCMKDGSCAIHSDSWLQQKTKASASAFTLSNAGLAEAVSSVAGVRVKRRLARDPLVIHRNAEAMGLNLTSTHVSLIAALTEAGLSALQVGSDSEEVPDQVDKSIKIAAAWESMQNDLANEVDAVLAGGIELAFSTYGEEQMTTEDLMKAIETPLKEAGTELLVMGLNMVNPLLGMVAGFVVPQILGFFGFFPVGDPLKKLYDTIMEEVKTIVQKAVLENNFRNTQASVKATLEELRWMPEILSQQGEGSGAALALHTQFVWHMSMQMDLAQLAAEMWGAHCLHDSPSSLCEDWRKMGTILPALDVVELHIQELLEMARIEPSYAKSILRHMQDVVSGHIAQAMESFIVYKNHRLSFIHENGDQWASFMQTPSDFGDAISTRATMGAPPEKSSSNLEVTVQKKGQDIDTGNADKSPGYWDTVMDVSQDIDSKVLKAIDNILAQVAAGKGQHNVFKLDLSWRIFNMAHAMDKTSHENWFEPWKQKQGTCPHCAMTGWFVSGGGNMGTDHIELLSVYKFAAETASNMDVQENSIEDAAGWKICPWGYWLNGLQKAHGFWEVHAIDKMKCAKPTSWPSRWGHCYNFDVSPFLKDDKYYGWLECKPGYAMIGFYRHQDPGMKAITAFGCCAPEVESKSCPQECKSSSSLPIWGSCAKGCVLDNKCSADQCQGTNAVSCYDCAFD